MDKTLTPSPWTTQMDYPKNTISDEYYIKKLRFYTYTARIDRHKFLFLMAFAAILNNYTEITTAGHQKRRFNPHEVNFRSVVVGLAVP